ncbi:hypothetical protein MVES1_002351 [Malassezia vespertilionis]|uniref:uncharacterized protein n=1 Tax=Malassezia vespertilionis TaxID=2020962 RepID=UPI0024B1FE8B|nr:uncharacterized protein MVES1_002351 [Malassezia vespertilionis]WFD06996.1 hypothetical protein MVES1_002351 [Malassezia vespertilionis]
MGAATSKPDTEKDGASVDKFAIAQTLSEKMKQVKPDTSAASPDVSRQGILDKSIQDKIHDELSKLRKQEQDMQKQIELALEKENIEKQGKPWFGKDKGQSSELLKKELDRVKAKIDKCATRDIDSFPSLKSARDDVVQCYTNKPARTLDCWKEIETFKQAMVNVQQDLMSAWN